jgi:hypothetical protein
MDSCDHPTAPRSLLDYAHTPLRALALAEVNDAAFAQLHRETAPERHLAIPERLIPPDCTDLDAAHAYLESAINNARTTFPVAASTLAAWGPALRHRVPTARQDRDPRNGRAHRRSPKRRHTRQIASTTATRAQQSSCGMRRATRNGTAVQHDRSLSSNDVCTVGDTQNAPPGR